MRKHNVDIVCSEQNTRYIGERSIHAHTSGPYASAARVMHMDTQREAEREAMMRTGVMSAFLEAGSMAGRQGVDEVR